jgi:crossover junction endodeoxyribonuclease RuvC
VTKRVLGIDPGSQRCGYGVLERGAASRPVYVECGVLNVIGPDTLNGRLALLWTDVVTLVAEFTPDVIALETAFVGEYPHSALVLGETRGLIKAVGLARAIELAEFAPAHVKKVVTGRGDATKPEVRDAVVRALGLASLPALDASDATAIALCCLTTRKPNGSGRPRPNRSSKM